MNSLINLFYYIILASTFLGLSSFDDDIRFRKIDMKDGLSYNSVLCTIQDSKGFIWVGTRDGLNKYNSSDIEVFKHGINDSTSIINNHINCLLEASNYNIWVGTANGLSQYNRSTGQFTNYPLGKDSTGLSNGYVRCLLENSEGQLFIGTSYGLNIYDQELNCFKQEYISAPPTLDNNIICLLEDTQNLIWVGTRGGLFIRKNNQYERIILNSSENGTEEIRDIKKDKHGRYWVATEGMGIFTFEAISGKVGKIKNINSKNSTLVSDKIRKILLDEEEEKVWLATLEGISIIAQNKTYNIIHSPLKPNGICSGSIHDIIKDKTGGYWFSTYIGGLYYYHPQSNLFKTYSSELRQSTGDLDENIVGFVNDKEDGCWVATGYGRIKLLNINLIKNTETKKTKEYSFTNDIIKSIDSDKYGNLWIGTYDGLKYLDNNTGRITNFQHNSQNTNSINGNQIHSVLIDHTGSLWIGINGGDFQMYSPKTKEFTTFPQIGRIVNVLYEDRQGKLWIGERFGLHCIDTKTKIVEDISHLTKGVEEQLSYISCFWEDTKGQLWIGTQGSGIILIKNKRSFWINKKNGLNDLSIHSIIEDDLGEIWISTNKGISNITFKEDANGEPNVLSVDYSTAHGLPNTQFEPRSVTKLNDGKILFGSINGIIAFQPRLVKKTEYYPEVVFSQLSIHSEKSHLNKNQQRNLIIEEQNKLKLKYNERNISISFAAINYVNPSSTYYQYIIKGADQDWIDIGKQGNINLTFLPVGEHELCIRSSTNPRQWGDSYSSLKITVQPPFWRTWWAYFSYTVIVLSMLWLLVRITHNWTSLKNKLLMAEFIREKELELYESKLKFFTDISHELRTPLTLIIAPVEKLLMQKGIGHHVGKQLILIQKNCNRMMQLINQVLSLRKLEAGCYQLKASQGNIVHFFNEMMLVFNEVAQVNKIKFNIKTEISELIVWFDYEKMESIAFNLLSNAFKHTPQNGSIDIEISSLDKESKWVEGLDNSIGKYAIISITNSGSGISAEDQKHLFERFFTKSNKSDYNTKGFGVGLELTKRMVEMHKGLITAKSIPSNDHAGLTSFTIYLPLGKEHLTEDELIENKEGLLNKNFKTEIQTLTEDVSDFGHNEGEELLYRLTNGEKPVLLLVEDNQEVRNFIKELLSDFYEVTEAMDGEVGLEKAIETSPDLIISDVMMPKMDGIEFCKRLKTDLRTSHIPIILLTARSSMAFKLEGIEHGADDYISKPFSAKYLIAKINNILKQKDIMKSYYARQTILEPQRIEVESVDEKLLKKAVEYILNNLENPALSVENLSKELGLSRVHFYRKIKSLTNLTAVDFIRSIRLKRAATLLQQNKFTIKEIQQMVGFDNSDYFRKCFKAQYDLTPSEYASNYKSKD